MTSVLPPIPTKRYFTIGEVSELCGVKPHVLRYWEQEFAQLKPLKRRGNRRYYQHHEVLLIRRIRSLLYDQGFTISGARQQLMSIAGKTAKGMQQAQKENPELPDVESIELGDDANASVESELPLPDLSAFFPSSQQAASEDCAATADDTGFFGDAPEHQTDTLRDQQRDRWRAASHWEMVRHELNAIKKILEDQ